MRIVAAMNAAVSPSAADATRRWVDPVFFDFWATRLNPLWTWSRPRARLLARRQEGKGAVTLVLQANRHWHGVAPGQHVELGVELGGRWLRRHYSPTATGPGRFEITVKAVQGGRISPHLAQAPLGTVFELGQGFGDFAWPTGAAPVLLLAAGSGITPMRALLRAHAASGDRRAVTLMYWVRQRGDACFHAELQALAAAHPQLRVKLHVTGEGDRRVDALADDAWPALADAQVLACGPGGFVQAARSRLEGRVAGFQAEAFSVPANTGGEEGEVEVVLSRSGRTLRLPRALSLLEGLEAQGIKPRHGCRMGICNTCVCQRQSGATRHLISGQQHDEPAAPVRLCVQAPRTDLILEL